jgi:hypothetical protein
MEVAVLTDKGISPERARQALAVQAKAGRARLLGTLEKAMGSEFAGAWFDPAHATIHVGVASAAGRDAAVAAVDDAGLSDNVAFTAVTSTWAELEAAQHMWIRHLKEMFAAGQAITGILPQDNAVSIRLSSTAPPAKRELLEREAAASSVRTLVTIAPSAERAVPAAKTECAKFKESEAYCNPSITGGVSIGSKIVCVEDVPENAEGFPTEAACKERKTAPKGGKWLRETGLCSAGPIGIPENSKKGRVLLTAGHCGSEGEVWLSYEKKGEKEEKIGTAGAFVWEKGGDYGEIPIEAGGFWTLPGVSPTKAVTAAWKANEESSWPIAGEVEQMVGMTTCHDGQTTGGSCGTIINRNTNPTYGGIEVQKLVEIEGANLKINFGDSGGPAFQEEAAAKEVHVEGMVVAFIENSNPRVGWYQPIKPVLEKLKLTLLTKNNESTGYKPTPEIRPVLAFTDRSGEAKLTGRSLLGASTVKCASSRSSGAFSNSLLGSFDMLFKGCLVEELSLLLLCTGLEDTESSSILALGTFHLRYRKGATGAAVTAYLIKPVHFTCVTGSTSVLVEWKGCVAGAVGPLNRVVKSPEHFTVSLKKSVSSSTLQEITKIENETGTGEEACKSEAKEGTGALESAAVELVDEIYPVSTEAEIRA